MTHLLILSFSHLLMQVTWRKSGDWLCSDVARSREFDEGGPLTQENTRLDG